ncbi:MAG: helix-turn-helix domain-containing protein [Phycisphaerae bacterium]
MIRRDIDNEVARDAPVTAWPSRPVVFGDLLTPVEAAQYLRLDETGQHAPDSAMRTLNYWRDHGDLRATKFARRVWYRRIELDRFLERKTEE